jgi:hypothetical protein
MDSASVRFCPASVELRPLSEEDDTMKNIAAGIAISVLAATGVEAQEERRRIAPTTVYDVAPALATSPTTFSSGKNARNWPLATAASSPSR